MTNKTKTILCVCALTASAFAWNATAEGENYGVYENHDTGAWFADLQGDLSAGGNEIPYLEKSTFTALHDESVLSFAIERNDVEHGFEKGFKFGTYTYDSTGKITGTTLLGTVAPGEKTITAANGVEGESGKVFSEAFKANDLVGVWVQEVGSDLVYFSDNSQTLKYGAKSETVANYTTHDQANSNYYSIAQQKDYYEIEEAYRDNYIATINPNADREVLFPTETTFYRMQYTEGYVEDIPGAVALYFDDAIAGNAYYVGYGYTGQQEGGAPIKILVEGVNPELHKSNPTEKGPDLGGPLPGVWATIALAGAASAYLKRRRKENK